MAVSQITAIKPNGTDISLNSLYTWAGTNAYGRDRISLTEWDTAVIPQVAIGSIFEAGGAYYSVDSNTSIGGSPADGDCYILFNDSTNTFQFTNTIPVWDSEKYGYYDTVTGYKALNFRVYKSSTSYTEKRTFDYDNRILTVPQMLFDVQTNNTTTSLSVVAAWSTLGTYTITTKNYNSLLNTTTGVFTADTTGLYEFKFSFEVTTTGAVKMSIHKNDTDIISWNSVPTSSNNFNNQSGKIFLEASDFVSVRYVASGTSTLVNTGAYGIQQGARFQGFKIG